MPEKLTRKIRIAWFAAWTGFGVLALLLAAASAGGGHGDYLLAKILFPIPMLIGSRMETLAGLPLILASIEDPGLGALGFTVKNRTGLIWIAVAYAVVSVVCTMIVFLYPSGQFG